MDMCRKKRENRDYIVKGDDTNGKLLIDLVDLCDLEIINLNKKCKGKWTWMRGKNKSRIDYVLMNRKMEQKLLTMEVDEEGGKWEAGSDHSLIELKIESKRKVSPQKKDKVWDIHDKTLFHCKK